MKHYAGALALYGALSFIPPALACGSWTMEDHATNGRISFQAESMSIRYGKTTIQRKIRAGPGRAYFGNGDRAYYEGKRIRYWRKLPGKRKWRKETIGSIRGNEFEIFGLGKFRISVGRAKGPGHWEPRVLSGSGTPAASAGMRPFCATESPRKQIASESRRMIAYFIWKKMQPDLSSEAPGWWW